VSQPHVGVSGRVCVKNLGPCIPTANATGWGYLCGKLIVKVENITYRVSIKYFNEQIT